MNLDAETIALSQIQYLVTSLNKKNYKSSVAESLVLVERFGLECERHLLRTLFTYADFSAGNSAKQTSLQLQFLTQYCEGLFRHPNFVSLVCFSLEQPINQSTWSRSSPQLIGHISKGLKFSPLRAIAFVCALKHSTNPQLTKCADVFLQDNIPSFIQALQTSSAKAAFLELDKSPELFHFVLTELSNSTYRDSLIEELKELYSKEKAPSLLSPFLNRDSSNQRFEIRASEEDDSATAATSKDQGHVLSPLILQLTDDTHRFGDLSDTNVSEAISSSMAMSKAHLDSALPDLVRELGYQFTSNPDTCRHHMRQLVGGAGGADMHAATVARIIGVMVRTHTGLDDSATLQTMNATGTSLWEKDKQSEPKTWNVEVFIKVVHEMQPTLHWKEIVYELDHPGFAIKDRQGLILLMKSLKLGFQVQGFPGPFPVDMFYRPWKNSDGQVTLFQQALRNPDVFNFADHQFHPVAVEVLKVPPADIENRELASWRSLEVIDTLLVLAEGGHTHAVKELFAVPQAHCPDVLTLGLMQINPPMTNFRTELLVHNLQIFLSNHPNSGVILTHAWHSSTFNLKVVVVHAMAEWYSKSVQEGDSEHSRLSRILDVAQDLKALSVLLTAKTWPFVIDLAVLASRREYLNLDKWLTDQMRENGEQFVKTVVSYLQRKLPNIHGPGPLKEEHLNKVNFHADSLAAILLCLQTVANSAPIHSDLKEHIVNMFQNSAALLNKPRPPPQPQQQMMPSASMRPIGGNRSLGNIGDPTATPVGGALRQTPRSFMPPGGASGGIEPLVGLTSQMSLSGPGPIGAFGMSSPLGQIVSGSGASSMGGPQPSSPSRMFGGSVVPPPSSGLDGGNGGTSSPFNPSMTAPSPSAVSQQSSTSMAHIEQIRQGLSNISNLFPDITGPIAREVEDEANSYFQRIYNHPPHPTLTIDEVLDLLKEFQESSKQRERDVFNCMIKNLFEEYKYFPQYPEKELHITAQLFGGIIEHGLVNMIPLGLALRFVLDAVRKPAESKMYFFGIAALDRFKTKLKDYPQYCQHVSCITHFKDFPPHLIEWVEFGSQSQTPPNKPQGQVLPPQLEAIIKAVAPPAPLVTAVVHVPPPAVAKPAAQPATVSNATSAIVRPIPTGSRPSIANTTNIDTLLNARQKSGLVDSPTAPSDKVQDKVAFIFNNLSLSNIQQKSDDLIETLESEGQDLNTFSCWLAQYLVLKRASIEPNFHTLYASFLEVLHNEVLYSDVLKETFSNIRILLTSDKSIANFSDRSLLKNLGHWLGLMTLARNRPILMVDLDIKPLIIEAHQIGQQELLYVVPFAAKVLESCAKSKVFKPPSPWTMGIMNLLAELHQEHDLKLNLKFEIEVLCKTLSIELASLQPGNLLTQVVQIRSFGLKSQTPPATSQMGGTSHPKGSMADSFSMVHTSHMSQKRMEQNLTQHHPGASGGAMEQLHMPGGMVMTPGNMHAFGGGAGVGNLATASAPGKGLGGALMQAPTQQTQSGFVSSSQPPMTLQHPTEVSNAGAALSGLDQQSALAAVANTQPAGLLRPPEPKFHYTDINTSNLNGIVPHIVIDPRLNLMKEQPEFTQFIKIAIEKSIQDVAPPVIDRAVKIAMTTCEQLVKKDFALDHDENRMRQAAHHMVRNLTAGMAMITCRDHLHLAIKNHLKNLIVTLGRNMTSQQQEAIDVTVSVIANDNVELACAFIQKKGIEKATLETDKRLSSEFESRLMARKEGRVYCDAVTLTYQTERMPEPIRLKMGGVSQQQNAVYDEFARNIPGFKALSDREAAAIAPKPVAVTAEESAPAAPIAQQQQQQQQPPVPATPSIETTRQLVASENCISILDEVQSKIEPFVQKCTTLPPTPHMANLHDLLDALSLVRNNKDVGAVLLLIQKAVTALLEGLTPHIQVDTESLARYRDANLLVLRALADSRAFGANWTSARVTVCLIEMREEIKYNLDAVDILIRSGLVALYDYDKHLAQIMANGENAIATAFAMHLCKIYLIDDRTNANIIESDLFGTIEVLQRISTQSPRPPDGIVNMMETIKMSSERLEQNLAMSGPTAQLHSGIAQAREYEDPPGLLEKTEYLLREWVNAYHSRDAGKDSRQAFVVFVQLMNQHGILKTDDLITRFFRMSTQMCVDLCYRALAEPNNSPTLVRAKCFHTLDAYVRLITLLVKHSGETQNTITKVNLLNKVLGIVAGVLLIDHDVRHTGFQQVPYHRIFIMLFLELSSPDPILENINYQVLTAYCNMLHILRPAKATGFAFAWLEIVSHRTFMGRILAQTQGQKGWPMYAQLLIDLFKFLSPFLRNAELAKPVHRLYRGSLRVLLVLLHDFPEFLCDYHYGFCDVIPPNCIQLRNLILSAFPRNMRLPDPFTPNLKVELLPEISIAPRTVSNYAALIKPSFKKDLDSYLKNRSPVAFLSELRSNLLVASSGMADTSPGNRYNIQLINALVMYVGTSAIQFIRAKGLTPSMSTIAHSSHMDIFQNLAVDLETEGRYLFLNCIANQLRYPNSHTHYFSCTLLYLFAEANQEAIQEQITRVLLERLIVNRPHPWGLLITFIELIKNPTYNFWKHEFVHCAPEIQKLFESVARSCMVPSVPRMDVDGQMAD